MLLLAVAGTQVRQTTTYARNLSSVATGVIQESGTAVSTPVSIPTVTLPTDQPLAVPTVSLPRPTSVPTTTSKVHHHKAAKVRKTATAVPKRAAPGQWITAYLTSYCPGSAGWLSSSGLTVFYGMLANNYYPFGTHVYMPILGITGVVEDHLGGFPMWNHFDVWSPTCYGTPTGYFPVAIQSR